MNGSMEYISGCRFGTIPNHDFLELEDTTLETNCFMLSSRSGPYVSITAPYVVNDDY